MGRLKIPDTVTDFVKKYRYVVLVLLAGIILMCLPGKARETQTESTVHTTQEVTDTARELEQILSHVKGAGKVRVMLTRAQGERTIYQTNRSGDGSSMDTVVITGSDRTQQGLVRQIDPPVYLGAVIVCQGGDDPAVRLAIVDAVSDATGLGADKISVLKMK